MSKKKREKAAKSRRRPKFSLNELRGPSLASPPGYQMGPSAGLHMYGDSLTGERFGSDRERAFVEQVAPDLLRVALSQPTILSNPCEWSVRWAVVLWKEISKRAPRESSVTPLEVKS